MKTTNLFFAPAAIFAAVLLAAPAQAASDRGCWRVTNVAPGDSLNMRSQPSANSQIVDRLIPNRHGVISARGVCGPTSEPWRSRWCPISHHSGNYPTTRGWVKARFIAGAGCP